MKKRFAGILLFGMVLGCLLVWLNRGVLFEEAEFIGPEKLYELKSINVDYSRLLWGLILKRLIPLTCVMLLFGGHLGSPVAHTYMGWQGMTLGTLLGLTILHYGAKGLLLFAVMVFPHYLCYLWAWFLLLKGKRMKPIWVVIIGILTECYVNPKLLLSFLKIF